MPPNRPVLVDFAGMHVRLDNVNWRLDRVERRLDLVDESTRQTAGRE